MAERQPARSWVTLTAMGVATHRLRLATNIYLAALRAFYRCKSGQLYRYFHQQPRNGRIGRLAKEEFDLMGIEMKDHAGV